jgi:hypothetical protein
MNSIFTDKPTGNFIALYADGSGAGLFCVTDSGDVLDADGDYVCSSSLVAEDLAESGYSDWLPLPDDYKFWFMQKEGAE